MFSLKGQRVNIFVTYSFLFSYKSLIKWKPLFHPQVPRAEQKQAWPVCGLLSLGLSKLSGCLLVTSHQQDIKFTKSGSRSSCLSQNYDLIIHKHGFYTTGILYPVYLCLYPLNETMIFPVRNWQCRFRLNSNAAFSRKSSLTPEAHASIPWTSNTLWYTRLSVYGNTACDNSYSLLLHFMFQQTLLPSLSHSSFNCSQKRKALRGSSVLSKTTVLGKGKQDLTLRLSSSLHHSTTPVLLSSVCFSS